MEDDGLLETLRCIVGEDTPDTTLRALLLRSGGDVTAAANSFFDGGVHLAAPQPSAPAAPSVNDDVLSTLFKTLEDQGKKLAERDQQLDMATRVCDALIRRLRDSERTLASVDADNAERVATEAAVQTEDAPGVLVGPEDGGAAADAPTFFSLPLLMRLHQPLLRLAASRLYLPLNMISWLGSLISAPTRSLTRRILAGGAATETDGALDEDGEDGGVQHEADEGAEAGEEEDDEEDEEEDEEESAGEDEGEDGEDDDDDDEDDDDEEDMSEDDEDEDVDDEERARQAIPEEQQAADVRAAVAAAQASIFVALELPEELLQRITDFERQQSAAEGEWRQKQSRMHLEFEERKRRLQEQQLGQRKKLRESCDAEMRPLYAEGAAMCADLERRLTGKLCRLFEHAPGASVPQEMLPGPLARIRSLSFGQFDSPLRAPNCPSRSIGSIPVSSGIVVVLEKISDRNGITMLPVSDDPLAGFSRSGRGSTEIKIPLRLLGSRARVLTEAEAQAAMRPADERIFVVRYAGGEHGGAIEPVQILPEGLSLAEYDISFAAGAAALRVEHRSDGPVRCRAEPAAQKQVFSDTPIELYTQEVDAETHNIVQVYFSDLRDEVAVDVLNLTGTSISLEDAECIAFPQDATGAALNYKIIVRDGAVVAVLYQEGDEVHASPFIEHRLPAAGSFILLPDGELGKLGALPRGLIVALEPQDLPENAPQYPPRVGLHQKGKHPAELPGMVDLQLVQQNSAVLWPPTLCSVPVCSITAADSSRLREWHAQWDTYVSERSDAAETLASQIEEMLASAGKQASGGSNPKVVLSKLTATYGQLEEQQRELADLEVPSLDAERLEKLQKGISRFAALARFG